MENTNFDKYKNIFSCAKGWIKKETFIEITKETQGDQSDVFKLRGGNTNYFLKIGSDLKKEYEKLLWLNEKLPVPKAIAFEVFEDIEALLLTEIKGKNLKLLSKEWPAEKVVTKLVEILRNLHDTDISDCPFGESEEGQVLIHGDASLPNFIFNGDDFSGYIDLGDVAIGNKEIDFAAAIWSLQYNLGKGYGKMFLEKYGIDNVTEEEVESLRLKYEDMQKDWGLSI